VDNQDRRISGYRDLTEADLDLINRVKDLEVEVGQLWQEIETLPSTNIVAALDARRFLTTGFMWLTRSIARPADPFSAGR
jgi:hypothetical protein